MSQDRLLFIPWTKAGVGVYDPVTGLDEFADDAVSNNDDRDETHHKRKWTVVYLDTPGTPLQKIGMGAGVRVHVVGHGEPGDDTIDPPDEGTAPPITAAGVAAALAAQGLPKRYVGTIVCDVCNSANGALPFAKVLARALWKLGYRATCVMGYTGSLTSGYGSNSGARTLTGKYIHRTVTKDNGKEVKSKHAQIRFFGFT